MAPLKHDVYIKPIVEAYTYPWLKGHGSFEAHSPATGVHFICTYPWLKGHGSFEATIRTTFVNSQNEYPWLKGHGSFEASMTVSSVRFFIYVSMAERSWLL